MRTFILLALAGLLFFFAGCCDTYHGYGRYELEVDCDKVEIDGVYYDVTRSGSDLVIAGHTIFRGIDRKTEPWLYVHQIGTDEVNVTFEEGDKDIYPLYTGASASIFTPYDHSWELTQSTNVAFDDNYWLVSHRWEASGFFFDLHQNLGDVVSWLLVRGDIYVPGDGTEVTISEINTKVKVTSFDGANKTAVVEFELIS